MNAQTFVDRKTAKRSRVLMTGKLFVPSGVHSVTIRDISCRGARLRALLDVQTDCDAILKRGPLFAAGRIVWSKSGNVGLEFYRPLTEHELDFTFAFIG